MESKLIERKYPRFFSAVVRIFLFLMVSAFIFNLFSVVSDRSSAEKAAEAAISGEILPQSISGVAVIAAVKLLSGSLIISFSYLSFLFFRGREYIFSLITALLVLIFLISAAASIC